MKKLKVVSLLVLGVISLTACDTSFVVDSFEKKLTVYNLDTIKDKNLESGNDGKVSVRFIKGKEYIPYLSIKSYASLLESHFSKNVKSTVKTGATTVTWTIEMGEDLVFYSQFFFSSSQIIVAGSLDTALKADDDPVDRRALYYASKSEYDATPIGKYTYSLYNFKDYGIEGRRYFNDYYLPLGFLDITFSESSGIYFTYNYDSIYTAHDADSFSQVKFVKDNKETTVDGQMYASKKEEKMPGYLGEYNGNLFLYLLDNFYGLREYKRMGTAKEYTQKLGTYEKLFSSNDQERVQAYADTLSSFDDNHTALVSANATWGEQQFTRWTYGDGCKQRSALRQNLYDFRALNTSENYRQSEEILYSDSGKTAMVLFETFSFGDANKVFDENGDVKEDAYKYDSFLFFKKVFEDLEAHGGVENLVIDTTTNGGGVLGVMMKILALISKENTNSFYYLEASSSILGSAVTQVDTNQDGIYDTEDCYGDDFNIYILTSDCSFSCANAFPCIAKLSGDAKIIGQKSGGGECAVAIHYLPNSEYVYHSSNLHLGNYTIETDTFIGFEDGATPDIEITNFADFYNINKLADAIENQ